MFVANQTIKINRKDFTITRIDGANLIGTLQGDPSFLKGKRTVYATELVKSTNGFTYTWTKK